jgi:hypothetical protein
MLKKAISMNLERLLPRRRVLKEVVSGLDRPILYFVTKMNDQAEGIFKKDWHIKFVSLFLSLKIMIKPH